MALRRFLLIICLLSLASGLASTNTRGIAVTSRVAEGFAAMPEIDTAPAPFGVEPVALYSPGRMYFPVIQQPAAEPGYVSPQPGQVTQFHAAEEYGTLGLLAHNNLAGADFSSLQTGQVLVVFYANGRHRSYRVVSIQRYQALQPASPYSDFVSLDGGSLKNSDQVFEEIYHQGDRLVLQTCIASQGIPNWGRLFISAIPA